MKIVHEILFVFLLLSIPIQLYPVEIRNDTGEVILFAGRSLAAGAQSWIDDGSLISLQSDPSKKLNFYKVPGKPRQVRGRTNTPQIDAAAENGLRSTKKVYQDFQQDTYNTYWSVHL